MIRRLQDDGLVAESEQRAAPDLDDARRRYYRLTALGGRVLTAELQRLRSLVTSRAVRDLERRLAT